MYTCTCTWEPRFVTSFSHQWHACAHTQCTFLTGIWLSHPWCVQHYTNRPKAGMCGCLLANLLLTLHTYAQASHERWVLVYDLQKSPVTFSACVAHYSIIINKLLWQQSKKKTICQTFGLYYDPLQGQRTKKEKAVQYLWARYGGMQ